MHAMADSGVPVEQLRDLLSVPGDGLGDPASPIPFSRDAKRALELALREALSLGGNEIGAPHLLLALLAAPDGASRDAFDALDVDRDALRAAIIRDLVPREAPLRVVPRFGGRVGFRITPTSTEVDASELLLQLAAQLQRLEAHVDRLARIVDRIEGDRT
jgi:ATP-dependent Clp protease ATP-binding subunit ClpA